MTGKPLGWDYPAAIWERRRHVAVLLKVPGIVRFSQKKIGMWLQILVKPPNVKFHENPSSGFQVVSRLEGGGYFNRRSAGIWISGMVGRDKVAEHVFSLMDAAWTKSRNYLDISFSKRWILYACKLWNVM
jgi:hypothetical protein